MSSLIEPFRAIAISSLAQQLRAQGRSVIPMQFGQPSTGAPRGALAAARTAIDTDPGGYWESAPLKQALSDRYRRIYGADVTPDRIILTCGASPALVMALTAAFSQGDRIALARPGYVAYRNVIRGLGMEPVEIACGPETDYQIDAAHIERMQPPPAGLIIASPANPTGSILPAERLSAIAAACAERRIRVVSDEIYHGLSYGRPAASLLEVMPSAIIINSFSKYFSMVGWRIGWMVAPPELVERARAVMGNFFLTAPSLSQHAALAALACSEELDGHVRVYARNRDRLLRALPGMGLSRIAPPDGAFYIYADVSALGTDSMSLCERILMDTGVALAPGCDFDPVEGGRYLRFSFAVSEAQTDEAISRLQDWFARA